MREGRNDARVSFHFYITLVSSDSRYLVSETAGIQIERIRLKPPNKYAKAFPFSFLVHCSKE